MGPVVPTLTRRESGRITKGQIMRYSASIGIVMAAGAVALSMGLAAPAVAGAATAAPAARTATVVQPPPSGNYNMSVNFNGVVTPFVMTVTPGACSTTGCVGTWTPNVGSFVGTYTWHAGTGNVAFLLGQDHFYGKMTATGINSASNPGKLVVTCPQVGITTGTWYATSISPF